MPSTQDNTPYQFKAKEIRDILKSKAHCLKAGFAPNDTIIKTFNDIRNDYISEVGLPTYLSQMLGPLATTPMESCKLFTETGQQIKLRLNGDHTQSIQRFLTQHFRITELPFRIEVQRQPGDKRVEERFL